MVDVSVEIIDCTLTGVPAGQCPIQYEIKTFWCKPMRVVGDGHGRTEVIKIPGLSHKEYLWKVQNGENITVCLEIRCPVTALSKIKDVRLSSDSILIGIVHININDLVKKPYLNPSWQSLPIVNVLKGTTEGKVYAKIRAQLEDDCSEVLKAEEKPFSYFSAFPSSNPALFCPPHLIDHVGSIIMATSNGTLEKSSGSVQVNSIISKLKFSHLEPDKESAKGEKDTESSHTPHASPSKIHPMVAHNTCTSPEFPYQIPAVEKMEKRIRFNSAEQNHRGNGSNHKGEIPGSQISFSSTSKKQKPTKTPPNSQLDNSLEDIITALNGTTTKAKPPPVGKVIDKAVKEFPRPPKKPLAKSTSKTATTTTTLPPKNPSIAGSKAKNSPRVPCSVNPGVNNSAPKSKGVVPGLTIKQYKPPPLEVDSKSEDIPPKRRIAANIFNNNDS